MTIPRIAFREIVELGFAEDSWPVSIVLMLREHFRK